MAQFNWVLYNPKKGLFVVECFKRLKYVKKWLNSDSISSSVLDPVEMHKRCCNSFLHETAKQWKHRILQSVTVCKLSCHVQGWLHGESPYIPLSVYVPHRKKYVEISFKIINIYSNLLLCMIVQFQRIMFELNLFWQHNNIISMFSVELHITIQIHYLLCCLFSIFGYNYHLIISLP